MLQEYPMLCIFYPIPLHLIHTCGGKGYCNSFAWFNPVQSDSNVLLCHMFYMASLHHIHSVLFQSSQGTAIDDSVQPGGSRSLLRFLWRIWIALGQLRLDLPEPSRCRECLGRGPQLLCFCFMNQLFQVVKRWQQILPFESLIPLPSTLPSHCYKGEANCWKRAERRGAVSSCDQRGLLLPCWKAWAGLMCECA